MKSNVQCGMKGQYKVDIYSGKTFISTTDWFSNDITNTGVLYPYTYPFARCFMFMSIGSGQFQVQGDGTLHNFTGMGYSGTTPITTYTTSDNNTQTGSYMGWPNYASGAVGLSACGTQFTSSGMNLFRAWNIPTGGVAIGGTGLQIDSFMVSPSSGSDPTGCYAFSVVNQSVFIASGYQATIYYMLSLTFNDYAQPYIYFPTGANGNGSFNTGNAVIGGVETTLVSGWANLSGIYRQLFPGLQCVDNNGACVVTDHGAMLEPNLSNPYNLYFYLSPDISQFAVSKFDGTGQLTESGAYNSYGLCANYSEYVGYIGATNPTAAITNVSNTQTIGDGNTFYYSGDINPSSSVALSYSSPIVLTSTNQNIHLTNLLNISGYTQLVGGFQYNEPTFVNATGEPIAYASPGGSLFSQSIPNFGQPAVFSTSLLMIPPNITVGRSQKVTKSSRISPIQALGWNARYGSLVLCNVNNNLSTLSAVQTYPYMEYLFFDTSGRAANMPHYRIIPELYLVNRGSGVLACQFGITGLGVSTTNPNSPIQQFLNVTGFMGGYNNATVTGLDPTYPWTGYFSGTGPAYGNSGCPSGIVFSGSNIPTTVSGNFNMANGYNGYGAVYGMMIPNTGWTGLPLDCCLLDNPVWSGFSGDMGWSTLPDPTGETGLLCWPYNGSPITLNTSGMVYSGSWLGSSRQLIFSDPNNTLIGPSGYQMVYDVLYNGVSMLNVVSGNGTVTFTDASNHSLNIIMASGSLGTITGYSTNPGYRASGKSYTSSILSAMTGSGYSSNGPLSGIGGAINLANLTFMPTSFQMPIARIHHLEYVSGANFTGGQRLLPNYASGNNNFTGMAGNEYQPIRGGAFPGLSSQNGMQIYFDFIWSA